jgi:hypothetical protein
MNDAFRRVARTLIQLIAGGGLAWLTDQLAADLDSQYVPYLVGGYTLLVGLCQNLLEDNTAFPAILKAPPSAGQNPVPNDGGPVA